MLDNKEKKRLKQAAHHLKPVVRIGQKGVTEALIREMDGRLDHHELIKVHIAAGGREDRAAVARQLAAATKAELVHGIGKVFIFYRRRDSA